MGYGLRRAKMKLDANAYFVIFKRDVDNEIIPYRDNGGKNFSQDVVVSLSASERKCILLKEWRETRLERSCEIENALSYLCIFEEIFPGLDPSTPPLFAFRRSWERSFLQPDVMNT